MKIAETKMTVTTLDTSATIARNAHGGARLVMQAVVATTERGAYCAGAASPETIDEHNRVLAMIGAAGVNIDGITRGCKSVIELALKV